MLNHKRTLIAALVSLSLIGCGESTTQTETQAALTAKDAKQFLQQAQDDIAKMQVPLRTQNGAMRPISISIPLR